MDGTRFVSQGTSGILGGRRSRYDKVVSNFIPSLDLSGCATCYFYDRRPIKIDLFIVATV